VLPGGEGGAEAGLITLRTFRRTEFGSRIAAAFFVLIAWPFTLISHSNACSRLGPPPTPEKIFLESSAVFKGVVTSAELIDFSDFSGTPGYGVGELDAKALKALPLVKVRWRVEEIFKGRPIEGKSALIAYIMCVDDLIVVGQPYVFSISPFESDFPNIMRAKHPDVIGIINTDGTAGQWEEDSSSFQELEEKFRALSEKN
jgi:hypothetical protein